MAFKKGQSGNPAGRPEGSKNKSFLSANIWLELIWADVQAMKPIERQPILKWAVEQILQKVQVLPATPGDSASNGMAAFHLMNGLAPVRGVNALPTDPGPNGGPHANGA